MLGDNGQISLGVWCRDGFGEKVKLAGFDDPVAAGSKTFFREEGAVVRMSGRRRFHAKQAGLFHEVEPGAGELDLFER